MTAYQLLADLVLLFHFLIVVFVVGGLPLIVAGNLRGWHWANGWVFRGLHLAAIGIVVAEAWLGIACPLTMLETRLRQQAGLPDYDASFVEHWVQGILYYDAPPWVFTLAYSLFGAAVVAAWWKYPPGRRRA